MSASEHRDDVSGRRREGLVRLPAQYGGQSNGNGVDVPDAAVTTSGADHVSIGEREHQIHLW
jgi:hypothetical protein